MVNHGIPWYTMVFHGIPWYTMCFVLLARSFPSNASSRSRAWQNMALPWQCHGNAMAVPWQCLEYHAWQKASLNKIEDFCRTTSALQIDLLFKWHGGRAPDRPPSMYYHGLCTTMVYVLLCSMYYHSLSTTMVYVLPCSMYYHCLCTTMVYVLPWSMDYNGLCTTMVFVLPWSNVLRWSMCHHGLCTTMAYVLTLPMCYMHTFPTLSL